MNIARSLPFIILMVALIPFTRLVVGTSIGPTGRDRAARHRRHPVLRPARRDGAVREVDHGLVEAVQSMGGSIWTIVRKVLLPQALPSLISGRHHHVIALIGYSAMAGTVGGGGLGDHRRPLRLPALRDRADVHHRRRSWSSSSRSSSCRRLRGPPLHRRAALGPRPVGLRLPEAEEPAAVTEAA